MDDLQVPTRFHPHNLPTTARKVPYHLAHAVFRDADFERVDRLEQAWPRLQERLFKCPVAGQLERNIVRVDGVHFTIEKINPYIHDAITRENSLATCVMDSTFNRRDEYAVHTLPGERLSEIYT